MAGCAFALGYSPPPDNPRGLLHDGVVECIKARASPSLARLILKTARLYPAIMTGVVLPSLYWAPLGARDRTADPSHIAELKKGVDAWNAWRDENPDIRPDLNEADLIGADLREANLRNLLPSASPMAALPTRRPQPRAPPLPPPAGASFFGEFLTSDNNLSLILRRLDEIERKLDRMLEELRTPWAIGYSARRGNLPRKD